jgi:GntR family transcriptional regulator
MELSNLSSIGESAEDSLISFRLDSHSGVPTYLQLVQQVEGALRLGVLRQGDRLPKVKEVVEELSINPNTVLKAYRELESRGIARGRQGVGTFVVAELPPIGAVVFDDLRAQLIRGWLNDARRAGLDDADIAALFLSAVAAPTDDEDEGQVAR